MFSVLSGGVIKILLRGMTAERRVVSIETDAAGG
jgi:hypothetical protein